MAGRAHASAPIVALGIKISPICPAIPYNDLRVYLVSIIDHKLSQATWASLPPVTNDAVVATANALADCLDSIG